MARFVIYLILLVAPSCLAATEQDPTKPLNWQNVPTTTHHPVKRTASLPQLSAVFCAESGCQAVLNDDLVAVGSRVRGYQVTQINPEGVVLRRGQRQWRLTLVATDLKQ